MWLHVSACDCVRLHVSARPSVVAKIDEAYFHNMNLFFSFLVHAGQVLLIFMASIVIYFCMFSFCSKVRLSLRLSCLYPVLLLGLSVLNSHVSVF